MLARGPISSNSLGTTSTITSRSRNDRTTSIVSVSGSFEKATITRSTWCSATSAWSSPSAPSAHSTGLRSTLERLGVHKTDEIEAVFRMLADLARD